jgi:NTP pyrophosphatase (non-canonical NTP hydrolase)
MEIVRCYEVGEVDRYQSKAMRTAIQEGKDLMINGCLGLSGEVGEVVDIVKKHLYQGHELDKDKIKNELGDVCWYIATLAESMNIKFSDILKGNIEKLEKRYPDGFEKERSISR